jgi:hypothetical protein
VFAGGHPGVEVGDRELLAVDELLVPEADAQGHHVDAERPDLVVGEVAGAVGDDPDGHGSSRGSGAL